MRLRPSRHARSLTDFLRAGVGPPLLNDQFERRVQKPRAHDSSALLLGSAFIHYIQQGFAPLLG